MPTLALDAPSCQVGWFLNRSTGQAVPCLCKKISCPTCGPRTLRRYAARLATHKWLKFLTITLPGADLALPEGLATVKAAWGVLRQWLRRRGMQDYVWCVEVTQTHTVRPHVHMHVLLDAPYIRTGISRGTARSGTLNQALGRAGFGCVFKLRRVRSDRAEVWYVAKYLSKSTVKLPRYARRVQCTIPRPRQETTGDWTYLSRAEWGGLVQGEIIAPAIACSYGCHEVCDDARHAQGRLPDLKFISSYGKKSISWFDPG